MYCFWLAQNALPYKLEYIVNETCSVIVANRCMVLFQKVDQMIPSIIFIVHNIITIHVHIEFDPSNLFRKDNDIYKQKYNSFLLVVQNHSNIIPNNSLISEI